MTVVVCTGAAFSGVEGLWLFSFNEPLDPVLLQQKNQIARMIQPQQQIPRTTIMMRKAATASTTASRLTSTTIGSLLVLQVEEL